MRKTCIAILLVILFVGAPIFAATDSFDVITTVAALGKIKITEEDVGVAPHTEAAFDLLDEFDELAISSSGNQTFTAYLSTISNSRSGYTVAMDATSMMSPGSPANSYIDYTVTVNSIGLTTTGATAVTGVNILTVASLLGIEAQSHAIALSIDATTYAAAVSGTYTGTVTFTYAAT